MKRYLCGICRLESVAEWHIHQAHYEFHQELDNPSATP